MYLIHVVCLLLSFHVLCNAISEGHIAEIDFPYPCDSTEVTLQRNNGRPFYRSANPEHNALMPSRYEVRNQVKSKSDICFLNFTINPVSRDDEGTFILVPYKDGVIKADFSRIGLHVDYPPGKASCELLSNEHVDGEWVKLYCQAPVGSLSGQILCYQDDMRLPSLTSPVENGKTLSQDMLSRLAGLVYCCTSTYWQTKDRCECNDFRWNPILNTELSNIPDPCAAATEMTDSVTSFIQQDQEISTIRPNASDPKTCKNACVSYQIWCITTTSSTCLMTLVCITLIHFLYKARKRRSLKKQSNTKNKDEQHEGSELNKQPEDELE